RLNQDQIVFAETARSVPRERQEYARRLAAPERKDLREIIRGAGGVEFIEDGKIALRRRDQVPANARIGFSRLGQCQEMTHRAGRETGRIAARGVALELLFLDRGVLAPPSETVTRPLRMQRAHGGIAAPQFDAIRDELAAKAVEQLLNRRALQPFAHRPAMQVDNAPAERIVERLYRQRRLLLRNDGSFAWHGWEGGRSGRQRQLYRIGLVG